MLFLILVSNVFYEYSHKLNLININSTNQSFVSHMFFLFLKSTNCLKCIYLKNCALTINRYICHLKIFQLIIDTYNFSF